jgi:hypothetical protein
MFSVFLSIRIFSVLQIHTSVSFCSRLRLSDTDNGENGDVPLLWGKSQGKTRKE